MSGKTLSFVVIIFVLLGVIFAVKPYNGPTLKQATRTFHLTVKDNKLIKGKSVITVNQGDKLVIFIQADVNGTFQLHGYNKEWKFSKNNVTPITFTANISGYFPMELMDSDTGIGALEIYPK